MKTFWMLTITSLAGLSAVADDKGATVGPDLTARKLRTIVTTDGEADDRCSMRRFLLYTNEWDVRGLIHTSSKHHWQGDENHPAKDWQNIAWLEKQLAEYSEVYSNLIKHDPGYPSPGQLKRQVFTGNVAYEGDMAKPTPGSDHIAKVLLGAESSPVWLQAWGGANTIARALKTIEERHPQHMKEVTGKVRLFLVASQDSTPEDYIFKKWPGIFVIRSSRAYGGIAYRWKEIMTLEEQQYFDKDWMRKHILKNHGALCAGYEIRKDGSFRSEGDSVAFLHLINVGLRNLENPGFGGWGGRFKWQYNQWRSTPDDGSMTRTVLRWSPAFQNDWAARADWCLDSFKKANHPPQVRLKHSTVLKVNKPGKLTLDAGSSTDPDGDELTFKWWQYVGPGSFQKRVELESPNKDAATAFIPAGIQNGESIHFICEVTDDGSPPLTRYQRVVVEFVTK